MEAIGKPLTHAPAVTPGELRFSIFPVPIVGGVRSKAVDEAIAKHTGKRYRK